MMNATTTETETTLTLTGDLATIDRAAFACNVEGCERDGLVIDISAATNLGLAGMGMLVWVFRDARLFGVRPTVRAGSWARTIALVGRGVIATVP